MRKNDKKQIHIDSEIWDYDGQIEFTPELIEFYEQERRKEERMRKRDRRHISFKKLDTDSINKLIVQKPVSIEREIESKILLANVFETIETFTETEKRRYILNKIYGMKIVDIAKMEQVDSSSVRESIKKSQEKILKKNIF